MAEKTFWTVILVVCTQASLVTSNFRGDRRVAVVELQPRLNARSPSRFPQFLRVELRSSKMVHPLDLVRNDNIDINAPVTFADGQTVVESSITHFALYQDVKAQAVITVTAKYENSTRTLEGTLALGGVHYSIEPEVDPNDDIAPRDPNNVHRIFRDDITYPQNADDVTYENTYVTSGEELFFRRRRQLAATKAPDVYNVELQVVVDHKIWETYFKASGGNEAAALVALRYDFAYQMNGLDLTFRSIKASLTGFTVTPFIKGYYVAKTLSQSAWVVDHTIRSANEDDIVDVEKVLDAIGQWSIDSNAGRSWSSPDHTMLWTKYDLRRVKDDQSTVDIAGSSVVASVCVPGSSVSIVEKKWSRSWRIAAHELAHNLGALHDDPSINFCNGADNYIMSAESSRGSDSSRAFTFSACSLSSIKHTLAGGKSNRHEGWPRVCLTNRVCPPRTVASGNIYSDTEQCQLVLGEGAWTTSYNNTYCEQQKCNTISGKRFRPFAKFDGSACGEDLCCLNGQCVNCSVQEAYVCKPTRLWRSTIPPDIVDEGFSAMEIDGREVSCMEVTQKMPQRCFSTHKIFCAESCYRAGLVHPGQYTARTSENTTLLSTTTTTTTQSAALFDDDDFGHSASPLAAADVDNDGNSNTTDDSFGVDYDVPWNKKRQYSSSDPFAEEHGYVNDRGSGSDEEPRCVDILPYTSCRNKMHLCTLSAVAKYCRRTCNLCHESTASVESDESGDDAAVDDFSAQPTEDTCVDRSADCFLYSDDCLSYLQAGFAETLCRRSCNLCAEDDGSGLDESVSWRWGKWKQLGKCSSECGVGKVTVIRECLPGFNHDSSQCIGSRQTLISCQGKCLANTPWKRFLDEVFREESMKKLRKRVEEEDA